MDPSIAPIVSFHAIDKAAATLKLFVKYYFPLYGLSDRDFVEHMALYMSVEAAIYQADEEEEEHVLNEGYSSTTMKTVVELLKSHGLYDDSIGEDLARGRRYYALEKQMCGGKSFALEDVVEANKFKSFDVQILHRITQKLTRGDYDEDLLALFWIGDRLVEIQYDVEQYEEDVKRNVFNIYRMFLKLYRDDGRARLEQYIIDLTRDAYDRMLQLPVESGRDLLTSLTTFRSDVPLPAWPSPIEADFIS